jgi:pimeloyl-ACP methyl ester carboxylesterase
MLVVVQTNMRDCCIAVRDCGRSFPRWKRLPLLRTQLRLWRRARGSLLSPGPVGFRMILANPQRVQSLIVQDAVAHNEGLGVNWKARRAFWADRAANETLLRQNLLSLAATRTRHVGNDPAVERYDPDLWSDEFAFLSSPGQGDIQVELFYDYRTNVTAYPSWQAWMQKTQPRLLVIWGKYDLSFDASEPEAYRRDVPTAQVHEKAAISPWTLRPTRSRA